MKTLDHAFNVDGLRKSGAKLEKDVEIRANLGTAGCVPTPNGREQKQYGRCRACPCTREVVFVLLWHSQPRVEEIQKKDI